jgi:hypothetical protein
MCSREYYNTVRAPSRSAQISRCIQIKENEAHMPYCKSIGKHSKDETIVPC